MCDILYLYKNDFLMRFIKTRILTICTSNFLTSRLKLFDDLIKEEPFRLTDESLCLRRKFNEVLNKSCLGICYFNSKKILNDCAQYL